MSRSPWRIAIQTEAVGGRPAVLLSVPQNLSCNFCMEMFQWPAQPILTAEICASEII